MTLLEREPALKVLEGALGEAAHGEGRVALVYGEAGIGKTSLVDHFTRERAHTRPARTLWVPAIPCTPRGPSGPCMTSPTRPARDCESGSTRALRPG